MSRIFLNSGTLIVIVCCQPASFPDTSFVCCQPASFSDTSLARCQPDSFFGKPNALYCVPASFPIPSSVVGLHPYLSPPLLWDCILPDPLLCCGPASFPIPSSGVALHPSLSPSPRCVPVVPFSGPLFPYLIILLLSLQNDILICCLSSSHLNTRQGHEISR